MTQHKTVVIFGGTGFIGRHIVKQLAPLGYTIKIATRIPESAYFLKPHGDVGQIVPVAYNMHDYNSIAQATSGCDFVINCVGVLFEKQKSTFNRIHADLAESIATAATISGAKRLVHISALGVEQSTSKYAQSKLHGEDRVLKAFPKATILRPSIVFGAEDNFINQFARMAQIMPFLPLIGGGKTRFQPVFVGDVAKAVSQALTLSDQGDASPLGKIFELGGSEIISFHDIYKKIFSHTQIKRPLISMSFGVAKILAGIMSLLPKPMLTSDQVESLKTDNIMSTSTKKLRDLGIEPTALDTILPDYLITYKPGGRFGE